MVTRFARTGSLARRGGGANRSRLVRLVRHSQRAALFNVLSGTYPDSVANYFIAQTKDQRNDLQFDVSENAVRFRAANFRNAGSTRPSRRR